MKEINCSPTSGRGRWDCSRQLQGICFTEMETEAQQKSHSVLMAHSGRMYSHTSPQDRHGCSLPLCPRPTLPQPWKAQELVCQRLSQEPRQVFAPWTMLTGREAKLEGDRRQGWGTAGGSAAFSTSRPQPWGEGWLKDPRPVTTPLLFPAASAEASPFPVAPCVLSIKCVGKIISLQPHGWSSSFRARLSALPGAPAD